MNCKTFHRNLEDYLQGDLDFPGRFGIERHARQCLGCGKDLADAQALARMARVMGRTAAPQDFEAKVLRRIASRGLHRRPKVWWLQYHWPEWISGRSVAWAVPVLALVFAIVLIWAGLDRSPADTAISGDSLLPERGAPAGTDGEPSLAISPARRASDLTPNPSTPSRAAVPDLGLVVESDASYWLSGSQDTEYIEYTFPDIGGRPMVMRLPKTIRMRHTQTSEEFFIHNVSH